MSETQTCGNCRHFQRHPGPENKGGCDASVPLWAYHDEDNYNVYGGDFAENCTAWEETK